MHMSKRRDFSTYETRTTTESTYEFTATSGGDVEPDLPADRCVLVPMDVAYTTRLYPRFVCSDGDARWAISGLTEVGDSTSTRVSL